jgi:hypothetical protein
MVFRDWGIKYLLRGRAPGGLYIHTPSGIRRGPVSISIPGAGGGIVHKSIIFNIFSCMKSIFRPSLILLFIFSFLHANAEVGLGDWQCKTPGGNTIDNYSGNGKTLFLSNTNDSRKIQNLEKWYFYKGFVIGKQKNGYFIANEKTLKVDTFANEKAWQAVIEKYDINPLWTRWYTTNWVFYEDITYYAVIFFPVTIIVALLFVLFLYRAIRYEKLNIRKPITLILLIAVSLVTITYLMERFPQSI